MEEIPKVLTKESQKANGVITARAILMTLSTVTVVTEKETEKESEDYGQNGTTKQSRKHRLLLVVQHKKWCRDRLRPNRTYSQ